jgi:hypothetical protein
MLMAGMISELQSGQSFFQGKRISLNLVAPQLINWPHITFSLSEDKESPTAPSTYPLHLY